MPSAILLGASILGLVALLGVLGTRRPYEREVGALLSSSFTRRIVDERQTVAEMDLLHRMQRALLPAGPPQVEGWEMVAESLPANTVGGDFFEYFLDDSGFVWVAAGDVAGHGYSCAVGHAMAKGALAGLIEAARRPAEILAGLDRVLRGVRFDRWFTALILLRIEPASGRVVVVNAGFPYPLCLRREGLEEIELPGLPLGQGPERQYGEKTLEMEPGDCLVLFSDGLVEATGEHEAGDYGFDRPKEVVDAFRGSLEPVTPGRIFDRLWQDWRRFAGEQPQSDDATLVVVCRKP